MLNIIFDLDGTLINSKLRLYTLFQSLVPVSQLSYTEYWDFKQKKTTNEMILVNQFAYSKEAIAAFLREWMDLIEAPEFLALDENFSGVSASLARLKERAQLSVCTARQHRTSALEQLERLNLLQFFNLVLVTERQYSKDWLIHNYVPCLTSSDWMLGDTGEDINVGKRLNIKTCGVLSGFLNKRSLLAYEPDLILDSIADFVI